MWALYLDGNGTAIVPPDIEARLYIKSRDGRSVRAMIPSEDAVAFQVNETAQVHTGSLQLVWTNFQLVWTDSQLVWTNFQLVWTNFQLVLTNFQLVRTAFSGTALGKTFFIILISTQKLFLMGPLLLCCSCAASL